jgi:hypothetical protein
MTSVVEVQPTYKRDAESISDDSVTVEQPTAFISKLYEMINGAPDEVIAVSDCKQRSSSCCETIILAIYCHR